jgi:hypothetical protein
LDLSTAAGRITALTVINFGEHKDELVGERIKAGLAVKKARALGDAAKLGYPVGLSFVVMWTSPLQPAAGG